MAHTTLLPPAPRLLLSAVRPGGPADGELARALREDMDWAAVGRLAERERLVPVLWRALRAESRRLPGDVAKTLQLGAAMVDLRMALLEATLSRVVDRLAGQRLRVMLLKGAALARTVYGGFADRPMLDLDLLLPPAQAERAWRLLCDDGWTRQVEAGADFYDLHHHLPPLVDPRGHAAVELHRATVSPASGFLLDDAEIWRGTRAVEVGGRTAWVQSPEQQLLNLSIHFAWSHQLDRGLVRTARDVAMLIRHEAVDWAELTASATRVRAGSCVYWTLRLAVSAAGADVPEPVLAALRPAGPGLLLAALERAYLSISLVDHACPSIAAARRLWALGVQPTAGGHGRSRPWDSGARYRAATVPAAARLRGLGRVRGALRRANELLRRGPSWVRFAGMVARPRLR